MNLDDTQPMDKIAPELHAGDLHFVFQTPLSIALPEPEVTYHFDPAASRQIQIGHPCPEPASAVRSGHSAPAAH